MTSPHFTVDLGPKCKITVLEKTQMEIIILIASVNYFVVVC